MHAPEIRLIVPDTPALTEATRAIFSEYAASLAVDLSFQGFDQELRDLPGDYAEPSGCLLLALVDGVVAGCGAYRRITDVDYPNACEMKRLYVRQAFRRFGLGRHVAQALIDDARRARYSSMLLDTLDDMEAARELYASLGFMEVPPFYFNPLPGAHYLRVDLDGTHSRY
ncbi:GNAT family N-acetyltransferase [Sphaerotilus sp.]|uniref:GNAT family N-acetyltransferase n=1 Tax=Sphaerotilus sp. TaxID=2093942 RepID=UPI0034E2E378